MKYKMCLDESACGKCGICVHLEPKYFEYDNGSITLSEGKAEIVIDNFRVSKRIQTLISMCSSRAITLEKLK